MKKVLISEAQFKRLMRQKLREEKHITPNIISDLKPNEVFVFGSNEDGNHAGGAARFAVNKFGAEMGNPVGLQGSSYAIPTLSHAAINKSLEEIKLPLEKIKGHVDDFIRFAQEHPEKHFYVTPIGCGIAGFKESEIGPLFSAAREMDNISMPESFFQDFEEDSLNEALKSKKLDKLAREHGGFDGKPFYASELSDDEIGDLNPERSRYTYNFNDGTSVGLKLNQDHRDFFGGGSSVGDSPETTRLKKKFCSRFDRNKTPDGADRYVWGNSDAGNMVRYAKPNEKGKLEIDNSWREETPMDDLNRRAGYSDDRCNWEHRFDDGAYSYNASPMARAKADYATKKMTPQERHQYYKDQFGNRVIEHDK